MLSFRKMSFKIKLNKQNDLNNGRFINSNINVTRLKFKY